MEKMPTIFFVKITLKCCVENLCIISMSIINMMMNEMHSNQKQKNIQQSLKLMNGKFSHLMII
jgi:hypothetical protein